jgi:hypothetical protein
MIKEQLVSEKLSHWVGETPDPIKYFGFLYEITCSTSDIRYIGRKSFWKMKPPQYRSLKSPVRDKGNPKWREDCWKESDWKCYTGSSESFNKAIKEIGIECFIFSIVEQYKSSGSLHYAETRKLMTTRALESEHYHNNSAQAIKFRPPKEVSNY